MTVKEVLAGDSVHSLLSILDVITVSTSSPLGLPGLTRQQVPQRPGQLSSDRRVTLVDGGCAWSGLGAALIKCLRGARCWLMGFGVS